MVININIPKGFDEDITVNINHEPELPFSDGLTNEEIVKESNTITNEELKEFKDTTYNDAWTYLAQNMGGGVAPLGTYADDMDEVIPIE